MERFNLKKLSKVAGKDKYCVAASNRFAALEYLEAETEINSAWKMIIENINIAATEILEYYTLRKHTQWLDAGCSKLLDQRKQAKMQWLQDLHEINWDNLHNIRYEASRHLGNRKGISERQNY
jgi:hypothetical protein